MTAEIAKTEYACPRCKRQGLRDDGNAWHKAWIKSKTPAPWCCPIHGTEAGLTGYDCGCLEPPRECVPAKAVSHVKLLPRGDRQENRGSASSQGSPSDKIEISRGDWDVVQSRLQALESRLAAIGDSDDSTNKRRRTLESGSSSE